MTNGLDKLVLRGLETPYTTRPRHILHVYFVAGDIVIAVPTGERRPATSERVWHVLFRAPMWPTLRQMISCYNHGIRVSLETGVMDGEFMTYSAHTAYVDLGSAGYDALVPADVDMRYYEDAPSAETSEFGVRIRERCLTGPGHNHPRALAMDPWWLMVVVALLWPPAPSPEDAPATELAKQIEIVRHWAARIWMRVFERERGQAIAAPVSLIGRNPTWPEVIFQAKRRSFGGGAMGAVGGAGAGELAKTILAGKKKPGAPKSPPAIG